MELHVKYIDQIAKIEQKEGSDWIDLRACETVALNKGDFKLISLGVIIKLPKGYEAHIVPRSSTFKNYGIIQTNHMGVIDESYCGDNDVWKFPAYATRNTTINKGDRICQFRITKKQPALEMTEHTLSDSFGTDRGGFGSTGVK